MAAAGIARRARARVALAVGQGKSNAQIAAKLRMSLATVKAHIYQLLTKLGVANRVPIALLIHLAATVETEPASCPAAAGFATGTFIAAKEHATVGLDRQRDRARDLVVSSGGITVADTGQVVPP
jgi:DNA-binding CsgD family transcriptional regulator